VATTDAGSSGLADGYGMTLWMLSIAIFAAVWVIGTIVVVSGAVWLTRHEPH
jgi:hypothetical protein